MNPSCAGSFFSYFKLQREISIEVRRTIYYTIMYIRELQGKGMLGFSILTRKDLLDDKFKVLMPVPTETLKR